MGRGIRPAYLEEADTDGGSVGNAFANFGAVKTPGEAEAPIFGVATREALRIWLHELNYAEELAAVDVKPRRRMMLAGPPGTGKTTLAHHVAARLGLDLVVIEVPSLVSKYIGQTGEQLGQLFRTARRHVNKVALFFDEIDAIAHKRSDAGHAADNEKNSVVASLLQMFDRYDGLIFAATNRPDVIDPAVWRRFQMHFDVNLPGPAERFAVVKRYIAPFRAPDATVEAIADGLEGAAPALIKDVIESIKRDLILAPSLNQDISARSVFARTISSLAPPEDMPTPALWCSERGDDAFARIQGAPWPPVRESH